MFTSTILFLHICAGTLGLLSGTVALSLRKGSPRHALAGKIFVASMLAMAAGATYLAIVRHQPNNIGGGFLTFYLIGTAWLAARRADGKSTPLLWITLPIPLAIGILGWMNGFDALHSPTGTKYDVPAGMHLFMGSVCLLAAAGDLRLLLQGALVGAKRIARHLWRMCFGLFIAAGSFFLGPSNRPLRLLSTIKLGQHLPAALFSTTLYLILSVLPLLLLIFWLIRIRFTTAYNARPIQLAHPTLD